MSQISGEIAPVSRLESRHQRTYNFVRHTLGIDKSVAFTVLARGWASLAGLVTVALIARFLSPAEQGYYFTFGSLVALQIVFELGFSFVILQLASHERAHLTISNGEISGDPIAHARLANILQKAVRWYSSAAVLLVIFLVFAGSHFFAAHSQMAPSVHWRLPWYISAIAAAITFQVDPVLSFMEGCGFVSNVARVRLGQAVVGSLLAWSALASLHGLFAPAMIIVGNAVVALIWLVHHRRLLLGLLRHNSTSHGLHWTREVWPFQWRIAISWICGYFIYQLFNPVLFAYHGAVIAGQMGMSLSLANALQAVAISWINTKAAPFGVMVARKQYSQMDHIFFKAMKQSVAVFLTGTLLIWVADLYMNTMHIRFSQRLLSPACLLALLLATALNVVVVGQALYLRAHKQEKFLIGSIIGAVVVGTSTYFLGRSYSAQGVVFGYLASSTLIGLPLGTYLFVKYRRLWHAQ
jgi:hypothetical protein